MSIWGEADASKIPDDPFKIEPNWYKAICSECFTKELDKVEGLQELVIKWKIKDSGSRFDGLPVRDNNRFYARDTEELDGEQQQRNSFTKMKIRNAFDLTPDEINTFTPKQGLGKIAYIEVVNNSDKNNSDIIYNNVRSTLSERLYKERFPDEDAEDIPAYADASMISDI